MSVDISELEIELNRLASSVTMPSGSVLFRCGDVVSAVYLVRSGVVNMYLDSADRIHLLKSLGPGEIAGLPAALTGTYSLSAQVAEDADLGFIPASQVSELFERFPHLCLMAARAMSEEIARMRTGLRESLPLN